MDRSSPHPTNNASLLVRFETRAYMRFGSQKVSSVACSRDANGTNHRVNPRYGRRLFANANLSNRLKKLDVKQFAKSELRKQQKCVVLCN